MSLDEKILGEKLGQGSFGQVYQAANQSGNAIKTLGLTFSSLGQTLREMALGLKLNHDNLVPFTEVGGSGNKAFLRMPKGISILDKEMHMTDQEIDQMASDILCAIIGLHNLQLMHLDVKPDNILVFLSQDQKQAIDFKLIDYGMTVPRGTTVPFFGTKAYIYEKGGPSMQQDLYGLLVTMLKTLYAKGLGAPVRVVFQDDLLLFEWFDHKQGKWLQITKGMRKHQISPDIQSRIQGIRDLIQQFLSEGKLTVKQVAAALRLDVDPVSCLVRVDRKEPLLDAIREFLQNKHTSPTRDAFETILARHLTTSSNPLVAKLARIKSLGS